MLNLKFIFSIRSDSFDRNLTARLIRKYLHNNQDGFTLIELIVVVVIIGILSAIAIPSFQNAGDKAKQKEASVLVNNYLKAAQAFYAEYGFLPEYSRDLGNFITVTGCRTHDQTYCKKSPLEDFSNRPLRVWYIPSGDMRIYSYKTNIRYQIVAMPDGSDYAKDYGVSGCFNSSNGAVKVLEMTRQGPPVPRINC